MVMEVPAYHISECWVIVFIKEDLSVWESGFDSFLERVNDINFLTCSYEDEWYVGILQHVEDLIQHMLLTPLNVEINIFEDKQYA